VAYQAGQFVLYPQFLLFEIVDDVVIRVGSAFFVGDFRIEVGVLDLQGLKMWLCDHSQLSRLEVAVTLFASVGRLEAQC
jgi:hypothetical protein